MLVQLIFNSKKFNLIKKLKIMFSNLFGEEAVQHWINNVIFFATFHNRKGKMTLHFLTIKKKCFLDCRFPSLFAVVHVSLAIRGAYVPDESQNENTESALLRGHSNNTWHSRGGGGGSRQCHQMSHGGGGSKIGLKSVTYYLNGPLINA